MRISIPVGILLVAIGVAWVGLSGHDARALYEQALAARDRGDLEAAERLIRRAAEASDEIDSPEIRVGNRFEISNALAEILFARERPREAAEALEASWRILSERQLPEEKLRRGIREVHRVAAESLDDEELVALHRRFSEQSLKVGRERGGLYYSDAVAQLDAEIALVKDRFGTLDPHLLEPLGVRADLYARTGDRRTASTLYTQIRAIRAE